MFFLLVSYLQKQIEEKPFKMYGNIIVAERAHYCVNVLFRLNFSFYIEYTTL